MGFPLVKENPMKPHLDQKTFVTPWNKGRLVGQKAPLKHKEIWAIRIRLQLTERTRDLGLFNLAIDSKLRGCDLVSLRVCDVAQGKTILPRRGHATQDTDRCSSKSPNRPGSRSPPGSIKRTAPPISTSFRAGLAKSPHLSTRQ
jgi:hypothetical protein